MAAARLSCSPRGRSVGRARLIRRAAGLTWAEQMKEVKDTVRSTVHVAYDGTVHKVFKGTDARKRYDTERRVLEVLEERGCPNVPRLLEHDDAKLKIVTTNCGHSVTRMSDKRVSELFDELETKYGVRHGDRFLRNITYDHRKGCFCVIDFELAEIVR